jgi:hypothetical protein
LRDGIWIDLYLTHNHHQRLLVLPVDQWLQGVRFRLDETWGGLPSRVFQFSVW